MNEDWNGIPRNKVPWYPAIDIEKCMGCGTCINFCSHGTYEWDNESKKPFVKNPFNCVVGCSGCKPECPAEAISFPPLTILGELLEKNKGTMKKKNLVKLGTVTVLVLAVSAIFLIKWANRNKPATCDIKPTSSSTEQLKKLPANILAEGVNFKITKTYFTERYSFLPDNYKAVFNNDQVGFLDQLIIREILYQETLKKGFGKNTSGISDIEQKKDKAIGDFFADLSSKISISDTEMRTFYNEHSAEVQGASFDQVKLSIQDYLTKQKAQELMNQTIQNLRQKAHIVKNEEWVALQIANKPKSLLTEALKNGKPTVVDFGSSGCTPCEMMKKVFAELEVEYKGRANTLLIDIHDYREEANQYQIRVIPTQIFFDQNGKQVWRHEGFLAKEEIDKKFQELGVK